MKKIFLALFTIAILIVGYTSTNSAEEKIGIRGDVTSIYMSSDSSSIIVDGKIEEDTIYEKVTVNITKDTIIQNKNKDKIYNITDFELGMTVEVTFDGSVTQNEKLTEGNAKVITVINE